jgi:hypothetical protein
MIKNKKSILDIIQLARAGWERVKNKELLFQVGFFWVLTPCSFVVGQQIFTTNMQGAWASEKFVSYRSSTCVYNPEDVGSNLHRRFYYVIIHTLNKSLQE